MDEPLSPSQWCQAFYFSVGLFLVSVHLVGPVSLRANWLGYGPRNEGADGTGSQPAAIVTRLDKFAVAVRSYASVPHSWFIHFYLTSVSLSAFWAYQLTTQGNIASYLIRWQAESGGGSSPSMTVTQVALLWGMMLFQGLRRLTECVVVMKLSAKSKMWVVYWLVAELFYLCMSISVWIEGSGTYLPSLSTIPSCSLLADAQLIPTRCPP